MRKLVLTALLFSSITVSYYSQDKVGALRYLQPLMRLFRRTFSQ